MGKQSGAWQRGVLRWRYLIAALAVMVLVFALVMRGVMSDREEVLARQAAADCDLTLAQERYDALTVRLQQIGSSGYIENIARQNFAFLKDGELRFEVTNPEDLNGYTYEEMKILQQERRGE